jgi:hypothetical protein
VERLLGRSLIVTLKEGAAPRRALLDRKHGRLVDHSEEPDAANSRYLRRSSATGGETVASCGARGMTEEG